MRPIRFNAYTKRKKKTPPPHPLVRRAQRGAELATIEAWRARHGVTLCPPAYAVMTSQAARDPVFIACAPGDLAAAPATSAADCVSWLQRHGYAVTPAAGGGYKLQGRLFHEPALIARVARLQARATASRAVARQTILSTLTDCAVAGRRCPTYRSLHRRLYRQGFDVPRDDGIRHLIGELVAAGDIDVRVGANKVRIITLLTGPFAGASTATPLPALAA
jgi:hypothetical protein